MRRLALIAALAALAGAVSLAGCAGYRGGWASVPYTGDRAPHPTDLPESARLFDLEEVKVPGTRLRVSLNNRLRSYDYQVWFAVVPVSGDPRDALLGDQDSKTRVYLSVTPQTAGFVFRGRAAKLEIDGRVYMPIAARRFGQFDAAGNVVERGGKWQYVELGPEFALTQPGTIYGLSLVFDVPVPAAETAKISIDLSEALRDPALPPMPLIRFQPVRWREGYT
jgi:hypothetical protein